MCRRWTNGVRGVKPLALLVLAMVAVFGLLGGATSRVDAAGDARRGGTFRIAMVGGTSFDFIDPALAYTSGAWALLDTTCLRLMSYPDRPPFRLRAEAATKYPEVTNNGRTFTFTIRPGLQF